MYNEMSPADYAAMNNGGFGGFGGGNIFWVVLLFVIFGCGFGGGWGGQNAGGSVKDAYTLSSDFAAIQRQLSDGFNGIDNALDRQNAGICDLGYTALAQNGQTNTNIMQTGNAIQTQLADCCCKTQSGLERINTGVAMATGDIKAAIKDCCCDTEKQFMQTRFDMQQYNCVTQSALDKLGDRIIGHMDAAEKQALRDENLFLKFDRSQYAQNDYLVDRLAPKAPVAAFNVPAPWQYGNCNNRCGNGGWN